MKGMGPANNVWRNQLIGIFSSYVNWTGNIENAGRAPNWLYQSAVYAAQNEESGLLHAGDAMQKKKIWYTFYVNVWRWKRQGCQPWALPGYTQSK